MEWFLYFMGSLWLVIGVLIVLYTQPACEFANSMWGEEFSRYWGLLPFVLGVMLIISAWWSKSFWGILLLGILATSKGIYILVTPPEQVQGVWRFWQKHLGEKGYRLVGLIAVILGIFVISAAGSS